MPKRGTIVIFSTAYLPMVGGAETAIKGITENSANFHYIILTSLFDKSLPRAEKVGNILIYRLGFGIFLDKFLLPFNSFFKFIALSKHFEDRKVLIWGMMISYGTIGAWFVKFFYPKVPFIVSLQEGNDEWRRNRFWWKRILKKVDYLTAISSFLLQEAKRAGYNGKAGLVPNGVQVEKFNPPVGKDLIKNGHKIISVSRKVYKNGLDILEQAFGIVKRKYPDAELKIVDNIPHEKIPQELWDADMFVRPSRSEGLGTAFLEAMAAGLPIIATSVGGINDFLIDKETGLVVKVDDPQDLADKVELLFEDEILRSKLIENGKKLVEEKYQWSKISKDIEKIFQELL